MPPHTSHLLQPLNVGCFSPLKVLYGHKVSELARQSIYHVDKDKFLYIYARVRTSVLLGQNVLSGFQATGLILFSPERVLESLTVVRMPSPLGTTADRSGA
jgi:UDP-N-acetylglucosamine pyrophosphorylase